MTYSNNRWTIYSLGVYPSHSVLAGQQKRTFIDSFETLEQAKEQYPTAIVNSNGTSYRAPDLSHLPDDGDLYRNARGTNEKGVTDLRRNATKPLRPVKAIARGDGQNNERPPAEVLTALILNSSGVKGYDCRGVRDTRRDENYEIAL